MSRASVAVACCLLVTLAGPARAHRLNVEARVEAGRVRVDVYFSDGTAPAGAEVVVATPGGAEVARGATDASGRWSFVPPAPGRYEVSVTEPGLHRGRAVVVVAPADVGRAGDVAGPTSADVAAPASQTEAATPPPRSGWTDRGGVDWTRTLAGLLVIAALAAGLAAWQRRRAP